MDNTIHIGKMVREYIDLKRYKRTVVAKWVGMGSTGIYAYEKRASMETGSLLRFCHALKYNFFMDIANAMPPEYAYSKLEVSPRDQEIADLKQEVALLKRDNELLKELVLKRN